MKAKYAFLLLAIALAIGTACPLDTQAQHVESFVAKTTVSDETVTFKPQGSYVGFNMQVAGPDAFYYVENFKGDEVPSLQLQAGEMPDGPYTIRVTAQPIIDKAFRARLEEARAQGDQRQMNKLFKEAGLSQRSMVHSVNIGIADGKFIDPYAEEPPAADLGDNSPAETPSDLGTLTPVQLSHLLLDGMVPVSGPMADATATQATASSVQGALQPAAALPASLAPYAETEARWFKTYFQNEMGDGLTQMFEVYMRPVEVNGLGEGSVFQSYFRAATPDGAGFGTWFAGYFQSTGDTFRLLDDTQVDLPDEDTDPALFDYLTETEADQALDANAPRRATVLATNDGVIRNSLCVGTDCPNSPSFGFDTARLQENNLRLNYDDTSTAGAFPSNDWRLTGNDSANGGQSYFSIDDATAGRQIMELRAGSQAHAIFTSGSNVGFGTDVPVVELHSVSGDSPTLRLQQDGSSGFTPQIWDVAGNEAGFFVRDATNGSTLPFRILPGAASQSLVIEGTNDVGIGAGTNPTASLHVKRTDGTAQILIEEGTGTAGAHTLLVLNNTNGTQTIFQLVNATAGTWDFKTTGAGFIINQPGGAPQELLLSSTGNLTVPGTITGAVKNFKIDHPLDPENKYLVHTSIESPDMMNVYNGNISLDANGSAVVELPEYFSALNSDYRYQLTAIGAPGPNLYVAREISGNQFEIAGGTPGMKVSWQVTGIRQDPWSRENRVPVEQEKEREIKGLYIHPKAYGQPESRGIDYSLVPRKLELDQ